MHAGIRRWVWYCLSLALAAAILTVLLGRQDWNELARLIKGVRWWALALSAVGAAVYWWIRVARWRWVTSLEKTPISWAKAWTSMLAGLGVGLITPFRGGEVVRPMFVPAGARMRLVGWVVLERMFDLSAVLSLCMLGVVYMVFSGAVWASGTPVPAWMLIACPPLLVVALGVPLLVRYRPAGLWRLLSRILPKKAKELAEVRMNGRQYAAFYVVSLVSELVNILTVFFCLRAFGEIPLLTACALSPLVMLHNVLPATPGGFGIRETVAVAVYGVFGFAEEMIVAAYLTNPLIVLVIPGVVGVGAAWLSGVTPRLGEGPLDNGDGPA